MAATAGVPLEDVVIASVIPIWAPSASPTTHSPTSSPTHAPPLPSPPPYPPFVPRTPSRPPRAPSAGSRVPPPPGALRHHRRLTEAGEALGVTVSLDTTMREDAPSLTWFLLLAGSYPELMFKDEAFANISSIATVSIVTAVAPSPPPLPMPPLPLPLSHASSFVATTSELSRPPVTASPSPMPTGSSFSAPKSAGTPSPPSPPGPPHAPATVLVEEEAEEELAVCEDGNKYCSLENRLLHLVTGATFIGCACGAVGLVILAGGACRVWKRRHGDEDFIHEEGPIHGTRESAPAGPTTPLRERMSWFSPQSPTSAPPTCSAVVPLTPLSPATQATAYARVDSDPTRTPPDTPPARSAGVPASIGSDSDADDGIPVQPSFEEAAGDGAKDSLQRSDTVVRAAAQLSHPTHYELKPKPSFSENLFS
ncbi:hypothetical protein CYMTET_19558 [Cymbomonas tetramitiformis]|uniref:Uncharacterized protein n=1 Tax=Cymbomonas tetramitiformis TaxID=36881 RepID=A0AAE0G5X6_9CHLO|nr:hypothetical protein CYMTET_19558 [Cymbomonas tetramitiformis]